MPAFEIDATDEGQGTITVTVAFEPVPAGFAWPSLEASGALDTLIGVLPSNAVNEAGRPLPGHYPRSVPLVGVSEGTYRGAVKVPDGEWAIIPYPTLPASTMLEMRGAPPTLVVGTVPRDPILAWALVTAAALVLSAAVVIVYRRGERS